VGLLLSTGLSASRGIGEIILKAVFFSLYGPLRIVSWYRNTEQPDQVNDESLVV
jgi:hypothetical protein